MFIHSSVAQDHHSSLPSLSLCPPLCLSTTHSLIHSLTHSLTLSLSFVMSVSFLSVYLSGASLILLLAAVSEAQYDDFTPTPDYDADYNATFDYSFYSNASSEDLERFSDQFMDPEEEEEEDTGGRRGEEQEATLTMATTTTTRGTTTQKVNVGNAASLPVSLDVRTLLWTLMILISLNTQQLQHTL